MSKDLADHCVYSLKVPLSHITPLARVVSVPMTYPPRCYTAIRFTSRASLDRSQPAKSKSTAPAVMACVKRVLSQSRPLT